MNPPARRLMGVAWVLLASALLGEGAEADQNSGVLPAFVPEVYLFPADPEGGSCSGGAYAWIYGKVGRITVSCSHYPVFQTGMIHGEIPLMRVGVGVWPYLAVDKAGVPDLRVAVTLPSIERKAVHALRFVADQTSRDLPPERQKRPLELLFGEGRLLSFDVSEDILSREFLGALASATERFVSFGENGKRKLKISKANVRAINEMLTLYDALLKDSGSDAARGVSKSP